MKTLTLLKTTHGRLKHALGISSKLNITTSLIKEYDKLIAKRHRDIEDAKSEFDSRPKRRRSDYDYDGCFLEDNTLPF